MIGAVGDTTRPFTCNLCDALCGLLVGIDSRDDGTVTSIRPDPDDVFSRGHICPKGPALREVLDDPDRLRAPLRRVGETWHTVSWDEALDEAATRLRALRRAHGSDAVGLYIGNPVVHGHRSALGAQLLQLALGSKNTFDAKSQDSNPRLFACMQVYGDGLSIPVPDVDRTDYLLILGANPAASNGSMMSLGDPRGRLRGIRERGGRIVLLDPRRTETATAAWCNEHHFILPGGDAALLLGLLHVLFAEGRVHEREISRIASGVPQLRALCRRFPPERVAPATGLSRATIARLARELAAAPRACVYGRVGTCQNEFGPLASWLIEVVNVVTGNFDRPGGVMFPTPAADIGALARHVVGNQYGRWRSRVRGLPEFLGALPSAVMAEEMETPGPGQIRGFACFAGNPVLSTPNGVRLARALAGLDFMVAVDFYVNETSRFAHIILPPTHVFESGSYDLLLLGLAVRNIARYNPPILTPRPDARDDWEIACALAMRLRDPALRRFHPALLRWLRRLPEKALDVLLRMGRHGDRYLPWREGLSLDRLRHLPHGVDLGPLAPCRAEKVRTEDGLVRLMPAALLADLPRLLRHIDSAQRSAAPSIDERRFAALRAIDSAGPAARAPGPPRAEKMELLLIGRRHLRGNNSWMHNIPSLVKGPDRSHLWMHPADAARLGLRDGASVRIASRTGAVLGTLLLSADIMPGVVSLPHGYGHATADRLRVAGAVPGPNINGVTDEMRVEPLLGTAILNGVPVSVTPNP